MKGIFLNLEIISEFTMTKVSKSSQDRNQPPPSVLVWDAPLEDDSRTLGHSTAEVSSVPTPPQEHEETNLDWEGKNEGNDRMIGFLLIPTLLLLSIFVGTGSAGGTIECGSLYHPEPIGTKTIGDTTYNVYAFPDENLGHYVGGNGVQDDESCELSDYSARTADSYSVSIYTQDSSAWTNCNGNVYQCESDEKDVQVVYLDGFVWVPLEAPYGYDDIDAYFTYDNQGLFESGFFAVATPPGNEMRDVRFQVYSDGSPGQFFLAMMVTPLGLLFVNKWASDRDRTEIREGAIAFVKFAFKTGSGLFIFMIVLSMYLLMTW